MLLLRGRIQSEKPTYCVIPALWHSGKGQFRDSEKIGGFQEVRVEDDGRRAQFYSSATPLCDTDLVGVWHCTSVQTHKMHNTGASPNVNGGPEVMITYQGTIIILYHANTDGSNREMGWGGEYMLSLWTFCSTFCKSKTSLKIKIYQWKNICLHYLTSSMMWSL
jgi:hypothetical protein